MVSSMPAALRLSHRHLALTVCLAAFTVATSGACRSSAPAARARAGNAPETSSAAVRATAAPADTHRVVLTVGGMYCESCESTVAALLRRTPGVMHAEVSAKRGEAVVVFDSTHSSPAQLADAVERLGYTAAIKAPAAKHR